MSEKIYAWLLSLYPRRFRTIYGDAAMQLVRDRLRDERGFLLKLRLWFDLLYDLVVSIPREYRHEQPTLAAAAVPLHSSEMLSFRTLEGKPPGPAAVLFGCLLSLAAVGTFAIAIGHAGDYHPFRAFVSHSHSSPHLRPAAPAHSTSSTSDDGDIEAIGSGQQTTATPSPAGASSHANTQDEAKPLVMAASNTLEVDAAERQRVIDTATANLKQHYFDHAAAQEMANALLTHAKNSDDDAAQTGAAFAALLTKQMREVSHDQHLEVVYSRNVLPSNPSMTMSPEALASYRHVMAQSNCTFEKVEVLPHNIGYLKLNSFPDPSVCESTATAAMARLNNANAIIFDLRDNRGGSGDMVALLAAYLFDHPEYMYDPRHGPADQSWTRSPVQGNKLADKPVYVLISTTTISAAEQFSYDLKMLKRATFVGETTGGSAHAGVFRRIDDHFGIGVPEVKAVNPFGEADWEGIGVEPDVKVKASNALETALKLAESKQPKK
jgi:hypothetical protein